MSDALAAPGPWWRSALVGLGAATPIVWAVWGLTPMVSDFLGGILVFLGYGPLIAIGAALLGSGVVLASSERRARSWLIAAPFVMWVVLLVGTGTSGPFSSTTEQRLGWSMVVALMYGATGAAFAPGASRRVRLPAAIVAVIAAPLMIVYDDASQHRWHRADFASAPHVLPVIPGYTVTAVRAERSTLEVDMQGATRLYVAIWRCGTCAITPGTAAHGWMIVDGRYELEIFASGSQIQPWQPPTGIGVRPATVDELASLPLAPSRDSD
ncbi:hypothetical protein ABT369_32815 [Dactylosporangium sp. NPDC000244]|uniref:hypothetical protein n=1 Tax=Dactylosporangium sp. NPDC000244 TaxID=3154365 RepID=UPI00331B3C8D